MHTLKDLSIHNSHIKFYKFLKYLLTKPRQYPYENAYNNGVQSTLPQIRHVRIGFSASAGRGEFERRSIP